MQHDREAAEQRRRQAEKSRAISWRKRQDGLGDLFAFGFRPPQLQAILQRIQDLSAPFGADDDRTADQRRFDALQDVLLGRYDRCRSADRADGGQGCDCRPGEQAPCGAQMPVLVPIGAGLRTTDEVAELVGHGPIEPDLLEALLLNRPALRAVFVDDQGVPVATSDRVLRPKRGNPASVRQALLELANMTPTEWHPRHPSDHPPSGPPDDAPPKDGPPGNRPTGDPLSDDPTRDPDPAFACDPARALGGGSLRRPRLPDPAGLGERHPAGRPGPYAVRGRLRRLTFLRAPRCEFPGCGVRAVRCDAEHDTAHPDGPSCACNLGPLCRRHHRLKQLLFAKTRTLSSAVEWTCRTGQSWTSPSQHEPPAAAVRPLPTLPSPDPLDELSPLQLEHELWQLGLLPDDDAPLDLRAQDLEPWDVDPDPVDQWGQPRDTTWSLDLADPYVWAEPPA